VSALIKAIADVQRDATTDILNDEVTLIPTNDCAPVGAMHLEDGIRVVSQLSAKASSTASTDPQLDPSPLRAAFEIPQCAAVLPSAA
jgi:hypothetical protein